VAATEQSTAWQLARIDSLGLCHRRTRCVSLSYCSASLSTLQRTQIMRQTASFCLRTSFAIALCAAAIGCGSESGSASARSTGGAASSGPPTTGGGPSTSNEVGGVASSGGDGSLGGSSSTTFVSSTCDPSASDGSCFSFFVTSRARLFALAEAFGVGTSGWGGDFRYGTGDGLTGADKICTEIAEQSTSSPLNERLGSWMLWASSFEVTLSNPCCRRARRRSSDGR